MTWFIGLMSGTSLDGVDGVLAEGSEGGPVRGHAHIHLPFPHPLRAELLALNSPGADELHRAAVAAQGLVTVYAQVVAGLLAQAGLSATDICAIGAHGQTVRHRPQASTAHGYTVQLMNGAMLAEGCGIDVVCDFRTRDVAAGGQGAPLVPAFHAVVFANPGEHRAVLNIGGIANLTMLPAAGPVGGFDCGPGNVLMDLWCQRQRGLPHDAGGAWAAGGTVDAPLLARLLSDPYFRRPPPKSTGRDLFDAAWLDAHLAGSAVGEQDVMATLTEFTARAAADALRAHAAQTQAVYVCGGGAFNDHLMQRLAHHMPAHTRVRSTADAGVAPEQVEALAFAWLASAHVARRPGNVPSVTGAQGPRVLGALYPAA
jgi:anhydro-N-acetylmuramic acid kinase